MAAQPAQPSIHHQPEGMVNAFLVMASELPCGVLSRACVEETKKEKKRKKKIRWGGRLKKIFLVS